MTAKSVYWCERCGVPLLHEFCDICLSQGRRVTFNLKPVFAEERAFHANHTGAWLPTRLLERLAKVGHFRGFGATHDETPFMTGEPEDTEVETIHLRLCGGSATTVLKVLLFEPVLLSCETAAKDPAFV